jgi:hypothetical protein
MFLLTICCKKAKTAYLKYEASKDRSYNVFDKAELSWSEKREIHSWSFLLKDPKESSGSPSKKPKEIAVVKEGGSDKDDGGDDHKVDSDKAVKQEIKKIKKEGDDHEIILEFTEEIGQGTIKFVRSNNFIPQCSRFRYFEVDVLENKNDYAIYVGIIDEKDKFLWETHNIDEVNG